MDPPPAAEWTQKVAQAPSASVTVPGPKTPERVYDSLPLVLTSQDGSHWMRTDSSAMGTGTITAATVDSAGHPVLVGSAPRPKSDPNTRTTLCGSVEKAERSRAGAATRCRTPAVSCTTPTTAPGQKSVGG